MKISIIVAMNRQRVIGANNTMPWHCPADLQHFKRKTMGKPIIMGRKTFASIKRVLPGRDNVILTRQTDFSHPNTLVFHDIPTLLQHYQQHPDIMVIGGSIVYEQFLPLASTLHITHIDNDLEGDTYFPSFSLDDWVETESVNHIADARNPDDYRFATYTKKTTN